MSSEPPRTASAFYRPELDGLRFFAFFFVYVHHTFLFTLGVEHHALRPWMVEILGTVALMGDFGVDLFFVLSAYLITTLLLREKTERGTLDVRSFYVRRVLRIWPLYFFALLLAWFLAQVIPGEEMDGRHVLAFAFFVGNWYFDLHPIASVAVPLWSVSVEEQFYLLWPWAVRRGSKARLQWIAGAVILAGLALRFFLSRAGVQEPWYSKNSFTRADGIALGILLAAALQSGLPRLSVAVRSGLIVLCLGTLAWVARTFALLAPVQTVAHVTLGWLLAALACAGLLFSVLGDERGPGRILRHPTLVYLGRISFGLYVFHQDALLIANHLFPGFDRHAVPWAEHFLFAFVLTVGMASLSYRFLELPFLKLKDRFTWVRSRPEGSPPAA